MITDAHIRYAQAGQLARLLGTRRGIVSKWTHGGRFAERQLDAGVIKGIAKEVLVAGIESRRREAQKIRQHQLELEQFLVDFEAKQDCEITSEINSAPTSILESFR